MSTAISAEARKRAEEQLKANGGKFVSSAATEKAKAAVKGAVKGNAAATKAAEAAKAAADKAKALKEKAAAEAKAAKAKAADEAKAAKERAAEEKAKAAEVKAAAAAKAAEEKAAKAAADKAKAAADYAAKIEAQKAATATRHQQEKLFRSFVARVKYMRYMDNPALGGLEGLESIGWSFSYTTADGKHRYTVERRGDVINTKVGGAIVDTMPCTIDEAGLLSTMSTWVA